MTQLSGEEEARIREIVISIGSAFHAVNVAPVLYPDVSRPYLNYPILPLEKWDEIIHSALDAERAAHRRTHEALRNRMMQTISAGYSWNYCLLCRGESGPGKPESHNPLADGLPCPAAPWEDER